MGIGANAVVLGIEIDAGDASDVLTALEKKIGATVDKSQGLEHALVDATKQLKTQEEKAKALAGALREAASGSVSLTSAQQAASDKSKDLFAKGISGGGGELAAKLKDIRDGFRIAGDGANSAGTRFSAFAGAGGIAVSMLASMASALNSVSIAAQQEREQVALLGAAHERMQEGTQGTITLAQESALREQTLAHGLQLTGAQYEIAARAAREYAALHNTDLSAGISHVVEELAGEASAAGGVATASVRAEEAINRMARAQAGHAPLARSAAEEQARLDGAYTRAAGTLVEKLMPGTEHMLNQFRRWAADSATAATATTRATDAIEQQRVAQLHEAESAEVALNAARRLKQEHIDLAQGMDRAKSSSDMLASALNMNAGTADRFAGRLAAAQAGAAQGRITRAEDRDLRRVINGAYTGTARADALSGAGLQSGGGPGFTGAQRDEMNREIRDLERQMDLAHVHFDRMHNKTHETVQHFLEREEREMRHAMELRAQYLASPEAAAALERKTAVDNEARTATLERKAANDTTVADLALVQEHKTAVETAMNAETLARKTAIDVEQQHHSLRLQMSQQWRETLQLDVTAAQSFAQFSTQAFQAVTGAIKQHLAAVIEGKESWGEALNGMLRDTLLNIATESAMQALLEGAKAIASAATYDYKGAGEHTLAAAAYAATAVATGVGAGAMFSAQAHSAGGAPSPVSRAGMAANDNASGGGQTINYNFNGAVYDRNGMRAVVREANDMNSDRGTQTASERRVANGRR